jgi:hypothetical protein
MEMQQQQQQQQQQMRDEDVGRRQVVHSQVRRIKEEEDKAKVHETYQHQVAEMRVFLRDVARQQRSRSPLGRASRTAISIEGDSLRTSHRPFDLISGTEGVSIRLVPFPPLVRR